MIIDNMNKNRKLFEWLRDYTDDGSIDRITGYSTIGSITYINKVVNEELNIINLLLEILQIMMEEINILLPLAIT